MRGYLLFYLFLTLLLRLKLLQGDVANLSCHSSLPQ
jgi:hypothetical protein